MIILVLIIVILMIPYSVDIFVHGSNFFKRLKIGRWKELDKWNEAITNVSRKWIKKSPVVKQTDNSNFLLLDMIKGTYKNNTIQSWQTGLVYLSLVEREEHEYMNLFISNEGNWINKPKEVDFSLLAYAVLKDAKDKNKVKTAMDEMYYLIISQVQETDGCVSYRKNSKFERYVDTVGFVAPFLSYYGKVYKCNEAKELALKVIKTYYQYGFHKDSLLPVHAYDCNSLVPLGIYGWGRGTGWYLLGLIETYLVLEDKYLKEIILVLANKYLDYQKEDGSFSSIIQLKGSSESSATSIFAYFYANCAIIFDNNEFYDASNKAIHYLMKVTRRNGEIDFSQGDTKGIGFYSITSDIMPFTQGMACRAINVLLSR